MVRAKRQQSSPSGGMVPRPSNQSLFAHDQLAGSVPLLREHAEQARIPLVATYRHLGTMQAPVGAMGPELRFRVSQAQAAFQEGRRKLYRSRRISVRRKAHLLNATVFAKLTQGAGAWPPLGKRDQQTFDTAVWTFSRAILCIPRAGDQSLTGATCCALTGLLPPQLMLRRARLLYLRQLVDAGPDELWAVVRADRAYCEALLQDVTWLFLWNRCLLDIQHPRTDWDAWVRFICARPGAFKGATKRACALELVQVSLIATLDGLHRGLCLLAGSASCAQRSRDVGAFPEMCIPCARAFRTRVSWSAHAARLHGYRSRSYLTAAGRTCLACGRVFASEGRLRRHLTSVPKCLANWGTFTPTDMHPQAPPCRAAGRCSAPALAGPDAECAQLLLNKLRAVPHHPPVNEAVVWAWVSEHIEPLSVLRATIVQWQLETVDCAWKQEVAENVLLLLDPDVTAEHYPEDKPDAQPGPYEAPSWSPLRGLCFASQGPCFCASLPAPPPTPFSLSEPTSVPLRQAQGLLCWAEAACKVIAECAMATVRAGHPGVHRTLGSATNAA